MSITTLLPTTRGRSSSLLTKRPQSTPQSNSMKLVCGITANMSPKLLGLLSVAVAVVHGHTVITYPGWRGNNLITNATFPFGMGWSYPCGGIGPTNNRTAWPLDGTGALAF